jgi:hypothetical protein
VKLWIPLLALICSIHLSAIALAHGPGRPHHRHHCGNCSETGRTLSGTITQLNETAGGNLEATLKTATGVWRVRLGAAERLRAEDVRLEPGDVITVTGFPVSSRGRSVLVAGEIRHGDQRIPVRDSSGCGPCAH